MLRRPNLKKVEKIKTSWRDKEKPKMNPQIWHKVAAISGKTTSLWILHHVNFLCFAFVIAPILKNLFWV